MKNKSPLMIGVSGTELAVNEEKILREINPAAVILYSYNYKSIEQLKNLIVSIKKIAGTETLLAVDNEGGKIIRFPDALPALPSPRILGERCSPEEVQSLSRPLTITPLRQQQLLPLQGRPLHKLNR